MMMTGFIKSKKDFIWFIKKARAMPMASSTSTATSSRCSWMLIPSVNSYGHMDTELYKTEQDNEQARQTVTMDPHPIVDHGDYRTANHTHNDMDHDR